VIFNPLVSLSDTFVADRGRFRSGSLQARALETIDRRALRAADLTVADTRAQADHLRALGGLAPDRVEVAFVGAEERLFTPRRSPAERFTILFVGKLIPLHGLETVLAAAHAAPELDFRLVGSGQLEQLVRERAANVDWVPWVEYERLPAELHRAGCALGIFGTSDKASRVIPNKAFQALACGTPLVTADTPAARELLADEESALLVPPGDARALAATLRRLAADHELARRIAAGGRAAFEAHASEEVLGRRWRELIEQELARR
jgi:glycosyltransferase involved in cell wall biosynthesis